MTARRFRLDGGRALLFVALAVFLAKGGLSLLDEGRLRWAAHQRGRSLDGLRTQLATSRPLVMIGGGSDTVLLVTDYACAYCGVQERLLREAAGWSEQLRIFVIPLASATDSASVLGAGIATCGARYDHFPGVHARLFTDSTWRDPAVLEDWARRAGIPESKLADFGACVHAPETRQETALRAKQLKRLGIAGTPTWIRGRTEMVGVQPIDALLDAPR